jgi:uncharacterized repeat protein (TIGR03803 family)
MNKFIITKLAGTELLRGPGARLRKFGRFMVLAALAGAAASVSWAQSIPIISDFSDATGTYPGYYDTLTLSGSTLYGTTYEDGNPGYGGGTVFKVGTGEGSTITVLHDFSGTDGFHPIASLVVSGSTLYGVTQIGGTNGDGWGTIFKVNTDGSGFTKLYDFGTISNSTDGRYPHGGLVVSGSYLYGTTYEGGANNGTVFRIALSGGYGAGYASVSLGESEAGPVGALVLNGSELYGVASEGGSVFKVSTSLAGLANLCTNLSYPTGPLLLLGSSLYGSEPYGGSGYGAIFKVNLSGGSATSVYSFTGGSDGAYPNGGFAVVDSSDFMGTAAQGGASGNGTIFLVNTGGSCSAQASFDGTDGAYPVQGLVTDSDGDYYGTTTGGGSESDGTVFVLPF